MPHQPGLGAIFGIVAEDGVPVSGAEVRLVDRSSDKILRTLPTQSDGGFVFNGLNPETDDYLLFVTDETGGTEGNPYKNALIRDRVQPVPVALGTYAPERWYTLARRLNPTLLYPAPYVDNRYGTLSNLVPNKDTNELFAGAGLLSFSGASPFIDGAMNLPTVTLASDAWAQMRGGRWQIVSDSITQRYSLAWAPDFSHSWGIIQRARFVVNTIDDYQRIAPMVKVTFDGIDTISIVIFESTGGSGSYGDFSWGAVTGMIERDTYAVTLTTVPSSFEMVTLAFKGGSRVDLYVGETAYTAAATSVLITTNTYAASLGSLPFEDKAVWFEDAAFFAGTEVAPGADAALAFYLATHLLMTQAEHLALRDALWNGGPPLETGYARSVVVDLPAAFYRFDNWDETDTYTYEHLIGLGDYVETYAEKQLRPLSLVGATAPELAASPIIGQQAVVFDGSYVLRLYDGALANTRTFTIEFWLKPTTLGSEMTVLQVQKDPSNVAVAGYRVFVDADGSLSVYIHATGETLAFTATVTAGSWSLITLVINKAEEVASAYINGVLSDTVSTAAVGVYVDELYQYGNGLYADTELNGKISSTRHDYRQHFVYPLVIGGQYNGTTVLTPLLGSLADFALYSHPLTASRIAEHYANKDVV